MKKFGDKLQYFVEDGRHSYVFSSGINIKYTLLIYVSRSVTSRVSM